MQGETTTTIINGKVVTIEQAGTTPLRQNVIADGERIGWVRFTKVWDTWDFHYCRDGEPFGALIGSSPCLKDAIAEGLVTIAAGEVGK